MSISEKQLEANRANAQLSTGPKTPEGKARSAMNGFQSPLTGLTTVMAEEDRLAQWEFTEAYIADLAPVGAVEEQIANVLANDNWRLNRLKAVEENIFAWGYEPTSGPRVTCAIEKVQTALTHAITYITHSPEFNRISLQESRLNRIILRNLDAFKSLRADREKRTPEAARSVVKEAPALKAAAAGQSNQQVNDQNGFVEQLFQTPSAPSAIAPEVVAGVRKAA